MKGDDARPSEHAAAGRGAARVAGATRRLAGDADAGARLRLARAAGRRVIWGLSPLLEAAGTLIWVIFIVDFAMKFVLAPDKTRLPESNWLTALALAVPALRVLRIFRVVRLLRAARAARGLRLFRVVSSLNRGMRALGASMGRRGFGYVIALTVVVTLAGAAGMYAFENEVDGRPELLRRALWWTAMLLTSIGSEYWPHTAEGRMLCFLLSLYGFAVFGYVTATLATFFIGRDAENEEAEVAGAAQVEGLRAEVAALREELRAFASGVRPSRRRAIRPGHTGEGRRRDERMIYLLQEGAHGPRPHPGRGRGGSERYQPRPVAEARGGDRRAQSSSGSECSPPSTASPAPSPPSPTTTFPLRYLALALEFQLGADILSTAIAPSWEQIGKLGAIAVIRTALNYFLMREMSEDRANQHIERAVAEGGKDG